MNLIYYLQAISHEWIIESCKKKSIVDIKKFALPSGWSIIEERYKRWSVGKAADQRNMITPFSNAIVLIASQNKEYTEFWSRVCKLAGATIRYVKSVADITSSTQGYMLTDYLESPHEITSKADHYEIPIVSTVWVVQTLILGKICNPESNLKLKKTYQDDDF